MWKYVFLLLIFNLSFACAHFPQDIHENPAKFGHHRMEFDSKDPNNNYVRKELGIANLYFFEDQDFDDSFIAIHAIKDGTLYFKSNACKINFTKTYDGKTGFYLSELMQKPTKCSIHVTAEVNKINLRQHNIVETGLVKINVLPKNTKPLGIEYYRTNTVISSHVKRYWFKGQGSIQRQAGDLTSTEDFFVRTYTADGGVYRVSGCGNVLTGTFEGEYFTVKFLDLYKKNYLKREDTCDFEISVIPDNEMNSYYGRFSVNIYGEEAIPLEPLDYNITDILGLKFLSASGNNYILGCWINKSIRINDNCFTTYYPDTMYWVRAFTYNGRKSVYGIYNDEVIWSE